jgi:glycosyltransferase involved in cell wall biosynthesis
MRIALISASKVPSRTANSIEVMKVCQAFVDLGHEIHLWLPGPEPRMIWAELKEFYGIRDSFPISWLTSFKVLRRYDFSLRAVLKAAAWDPSLCYVWPPQAAAIASSLGLPTALEVHDRPQGRLGPILFRRFLEGRGAIRALPITEALREWLSDAFQVDLQPPFALIAPMGVDLDQYHNLPDPNKAREELGLAKGFTAGYVGHLYAGRGIDLLEDLARRNPNVHFLWAGGEPEAIEFWRSRLQKASLQNVQLLGFVPNERLPLIQAACDVLLMPYERKISVSSGGDTAQFASPMKQFEYLASGRAILASDLPVFREVLNKGNAVLLHPEDVEAWDQALNQLITDDSRRNMLGERARKDAGEYDWRERARRLLEGLEKKGVA